MTAKLSNNASSRLATPLTTSATSLTVTSGEGVKFPTVTGDQWFPLTVLKADGTLEILRCTNRSGDVFTVVRGQEGTAPAAFSVGDRIDLRMTAGTIESMQQDIDASRKTADDVVLAAGKVVTFDGATADPFKTTLTVEDPTENRSLALPNKSGTLAIDEEVLHKSGGNLTGALNEARATVASHATNSGIWAASGNSINFTGDEIITAFPAAPQAGAKRWLHCSGAPTFTNNANISVQGGQSFRAAANTLVMVEAITTTTFRVWIWGGSLSAPAVGSARWWNGKRSTIQAGEGPLDGQELPHATYPELKAALDAGIYETVSEAVWQADPTQRGKWVITSSTGNMRAPDLNGKSPGSLGAVVPRGDGALSAGTSGLIQRDQMQQITGSLDRNVGTGSVTVSGAFTKSNSTSTYSGGSGGEAHFLNFDSANSPGARTGTETRMLNATGVWVVRLFGTVSNPGSVNAAQLATDLAGLASRVTTVEGHATFAESPPQPITLGGLITVAHGLGRRPRDLELRLRNVTAQHNWSPGEEPYIGLPSFGDGGGISASFGIWTDETNIYVRVPSGGLQIANKTTGAQAAITVANWNLIVGWSAL